MPSRWGFISANRVLEVVKQSQEGLRGRPIFYGGAARYVYDLLEGEAFPPEKRIVLRCEFGLA